MGYQLPVTEYDPHNQKQVKYWRCHCRMSDKSLGKLLRAIIKYHGTITDTFTLGNGMEKPGFMTCHFAISLPAAINPERFNVDADVTIKPPPRLDISPPRESRQKTKPV